MPTTDRLTAAFRTGADGRAWAARRAEPTGPCGHALCAPHGSLCLIDGRTRAPRPAAR